jgi:hypothetical protein
MLEEVKATRQFASEWHGGQMLGSLALSPS